MYFTNYVFLRLRLFRIIRLKFSYGELLPVKVAAFLCCDRSGGQDKIVIFNEL